jgi:hypothetical protein
MVMIKTRVGRRRTLKFKMCSSLCITGFDVSRVTKCKNDLEGNSCIQGPFKNVISGHCCNNEPTVVSVHIVTTACCIIDLSSRFCNNVLQQWPRFMGGVVHRENTWAHKVFFAHARAWIASSKKVTAINTTYTTNINTTSRLNNKNNNITVIIIFVCCAIIA